jgi:hypothetical protein
MRQVLDSYPRDIVEIIILHRLHFHMEPGLALKSFRQLKSEFVDWNEVRISPIREIQEQVSKGDDSLALSVAIKDVLEFVHNRHHHVSLEHLAELNLTDIRRFLKQIRNLEPSSIEIVLLLRKEHPIVPLTPEMENELIELGVLSTNDSRDRRAKTVYELVGAESALAFHHLLLEYCRLGGPKAPAMVDSLQAILRQFGRQHGKTRKRSPRKKSGTSSSRTKKTKSGAKKSSRKTTKRHR